MREDGLAADEFIEWIDFSHLCKSERTLKRFQLTIDTGFCLTRLEVYFLSEFSETAFRIRMFGIESHDSSASETFGKLVIFGITAFQKQN